MTVHTPPSVTESLRDLKDALGDRILLDEDVRAAFRSDFGRRVDNLPGAVARCTSAEEVAAVVRFCRERKIPVVARGQGHSQSGQSTTDGGVLIDTSSLRTIHEIDEAGETATVDAGVVWRELVEATVPRGLVPRVLTNNLNVAISGTLSDGRPGRRQLPLRHPGGQRGRAPGGDRHGRDRHLLAGGEPRAVRRGPLRPLPVRPDHPRQGAPAPLQAERPQVLPPLRRPRAP